MAQDIQFVVNAAGEKTGVILSLEAFEAYEEYLSDEAIVQAVRARKNEIGRPFNDLVAEMRASGEIDV